MPQRASKVLIYSIIFNIIIGSAFTIKDFHPHVYSTYFIDINALVEDNFILQHGIPMSDWSRSLKPEPKRPYGSGSGQKFRLLAAPASQH